MVSLTIYLLLLQQNVERNPGPKASIPIITYNTNGLGSRDKLKRLLSKLDPLVNAGGIVMLQETHIRDPVYLKMAWKNKFAMNCVSTNSAGLLTLYNDQFKLIEEYSDNKGRVLLLAIKKDDEKFIVVNAYYPNDHKISLEFSNNLYEKILKFQQQYPDFDTIYAGDLNMCISKEEDSLNRNRSISEDILAKLIVENNKVIDVTDAYRKIKVNSGYTWKRGNCYSRLDYIFVSKAISHRIISATLDWAFEASDHAAVVVNLSTAETPKGPGLIKVNTKILEDPETTKQIGRELEEMMNQSDPGWNPHKKLEFLKVCIRSVFALKVSENKFRLSKLISEKEDELNQLEALKVESLENRNKSMNRSNPEKLDTALDKMKNTLIQLRNKLSESLNFISKARWYKYGEKSNKFFLNLNKRRQKQKIITSITNGDSVYEGQREVAGGIRQFYQDLYRSRNLNTNEDKKFYERCPKLSDENRIKMDKKLELSDLERALFTCKDSAPGPDGIPYEVYKKFWSITGQTILNAWHYSVEKGILPPSHEESVITLLPKEGKDISDIKNWRPITLSNCDSKIITKALANKMAGILDSIIDPSQTAYVPGRSIADNLRSNMYMKNKSKKKNIDSVLISLDAKKAFDSVDHRYIEKTLEAYGFGRNFIEVFKTLYRNISARILVNGFTTDPISIERGVKQGDALSCSIFILCIDPVLRNMNSNKNIKEVRTNNNSDIEFKAAAYADDISVVCRRDASSIQHVFNEYNRLTILSGLELNADKTEILILNSTNEETINFRYNNEDFNIKSVRQLKICGLYFCSEKLVEHELNVTEKIKKLSNKIRAWSHRHLTMEGKILIVKTFGLSQLIYNMQSYEFNNDDLVSIERLIFKFLWSNSESQTGVDRIKRSIMKNCFEDGGLNVTDVESLDRSLKLRQFIRAACSSHAISRIQSNLTKSPVLLNEYENITNEENVSKSAQETINILTNYNRETLEHLNEEEYESDKLLINEVSSTKISTFLKNKNKLLSLCLLKPITKMNIITLADLVLAYEHENDRKISHVMKIILGNFPKSLINITQCFNENINCDAEEKKFIRIAPGEWVGIKEVTAKQLQTTLKKALKKVETLVVHERLKIESFETGNITSFRKLCKNAKLRNIYFRLIHGDFFNHVRMKKFNMTPTDECPRCGEKEDLKHLLWECTHAKQIWSLYNNIMSKTGQMTTNYYQDVFVPGENSATCTVKIRLIQELIQIERPRNWNHVKIITIIDQTKKLEFYNSTKNNQQANHRKKWRNFENITMIR